jgi:2-haloacid dehalogenase
MRHDAFVFDAYGTLFDVHSAVSRLGGEIGADAQRFSELWRTKQLEYSWVRTLMSAYRDFWQLTEDALDFALAKFPAVDRGLRRELLGAYRTLEPFPEVAGVLGALRETGARLAILSNGSPDMLAAAVSSAKLTGLLDEVFSIDAIRTYKTHPDTYRLVADAWGIEPRRVSFQSSNRWDIAGAARFGFDTVWVNRTGQPDEYGDLAPGRTVASLEDLLANS